MAKAPAWTFDLPPAARFVLAHGCASTAMPPRRALSAVAWRELVEVATRHRIDGLLVTAVADGALPTDAAQRDEVAGIEIDLTRARIWQERRLVEVAELLERVGVEVRVLKGLATATIDYPDPQQRPTNDVDLLVRGVDLARADAAIVAAGGVRLDPDPVPGYAATAGKGATYAASDGEIDLHRLLVFGPFGVRLDPALLWQDHRSFPVGGRRLLALGAEDALLHAASHLLVLGWRRALSLRDMAQMMAGPTLDPGRLLARARAWHAEALLATAVRLTARELGLRVDDELGRWAIGYPVTVRDRMWLRVERPEQPLPGFEAFATLVETPGWSARAQLVEASLRPAPGTWPGPGRRVRSLGRRLLPG